jgi:hypothetical protein
MSPSGDRLSPVGVVEPEGLDVPVGAVDVETVATVLGVVVTVVPGVVTVPVGAVGVGDVKGVLSFVVPVVAGVVTAPVGAVGVETVAAVLGVARPVVPCVLTAPVVVETMAGVLGLVVVGSTTGFVPIADGLSQPKTASSTRDGIVLSRVLTIVISISATPSMYGSYTATGFNGLVLSTGSKSNSDSALIKVTFDSTGLRMVMF